MPVTTPGFGTLAVLLQEGFWLTLGERCWVRTNISLAWWPFCRNGCWQVLGEERKGKASALFTCGEVGGR